MFTVSSLFVTAAIIAGILLYLHITRNFRHWKNKNVPYAKPVLFFGNIYDVFTHKKSMSDFLSHLYKTMQSPFVGFFVFDQPFLLIRDLELIKACLIKDFDHFNNRSVADNQRVDKTSSNILFIIKNPAWKTTREKLTAAFATGKMRNMLPLLLETTDDLVDYLNRKSLREKSSDAREISMKFSVDVIASCGFGIKANCFKYEKAEFRETARRFFDLSRSRKFQMMCYFFAPFLVKLFRMKFLEPVAVKFLRDVFWQTLVQREQSNGYKGDLIDVLVEIKKQNHRKGSNMCDKDILLAQGIQFFETAFEAIGVTMSFALYEISLNRFVQERLRSELRSVLKKHGGISYEAIKRMDYLDMTLKETLRKYPALAFLDRRCTKSYRIPGTDVVIEKGIPIYISLFGLHYDPQYFPNPEKFDPERFSYENRTAMPKFCYMPFGEGPHNCIGARFGLLSTKVALIRILMDFEIELSKDTPVPLKLDSAGFTIAPTSTLGLHFKQAEQ